MWIDITVIVKSLDGRAITFEITARDSIEQICCGKHSRFIVDVATTITQLKEKIDAVDAA